MEKNPFELITPNRFDLIIKYLYAKSLIHNLQTTFYKDVYKKHLLLWNNFKEYDNPNKQSFEDYDLVFQQIIKSIQSNEFDWQKSKIPVIDNKFIVNGAHRVAASLATGKNVFTRKANMPSDGQLDCSWPGLFKNINFPENYSNVIAIEYAKLKTNTFLVILFPSANNDVDNTINIINKYGKLVYYRSVNLYNNGPVNLMRELYKGEVWAGGPENNFSGFRDKANLCFTNKNSCWIFLAEFDELSYTRNVKNEIRNIHKVGNHSVHINDTHDQTVRLARVLFNENSIQHLNFANITYYSNFSNKIDLFIQFIEQNNFDIDNYAFAGSSPLSAYGLREGKDLDYIHSSNVLPLPVNDDSISSHNTYGIELYEPSYDNIIFNPNNHFYHLGVKFVSLDIIEKMKTKRNEPKDVIDVKLIENISKIYVET